MRDLLNDEDYCTGDAVLVAAADVPVVSDDERPAWDREDDGYDYTDGMA
jgi:hypothetical protein